MGKCISHDKRTPEVTSMRQNAVLSVSSALERYLHKAIFWWAEDKQNNLCGASFKLFKKKRMDYRDFRALKQVLNNTELLTSGWWWFHAHLMQSKG